MAMRAKALQRRMTASRILPPTFSKWPSTPSGQAPAMAGERRVSPCCRWSMQASKPNSSTTARHFSGPPAMPTTRQPRSRASWPTTLPTAPLAAETTIVSPRLRRDHLQQPVPGGDARHADRAEVGRERDLRAVHLLQHTALIGIDQQVLLPAAHADDLVTDLELRTARIDDFTDRAANHHLVQRLRLGVTPALIHAAAHIGVEAQVMVAHQHLTIDEGRNRCFDQPEVIDAGLPGRTGGQKVLFVHEIHDLTIYDGYFLLQDSAWQWQIPRALFTKQESRRTMTSKSNQPLVTMTRQRRR
jgi:hypothetical protein